MNTDENTSAKYAAALAAAQDLVKKIEPHLRARGLHVALTGSTLYGMGSKADPDIDLLVYAHDTEEGRKPVRWEDAWNACRSVFPVKPLTHPDYEDVTVLRGFYEDRQVDVLIPIYKP